MVTDTDKTAFKQAFNRLAVAVRLPADQADAAMQRIFFEGLSEFSIEAVTAAGQQLEQSAQFFPKVAEWREAARIAQVAFVKALPPGRETPWESECPVCDDSGWEERRCYPGTRNTCGRKKCELERPEHRYVIVCTCRPHNRTWARHHTLKDQANYAE